MFLSAHGHIPVIVGAVILLLILVGATLLSKAAHRLRQSSLTLVTIGFIVAIMFAGVVVLGHSEEKKEAAAPTLPSDLKTKQTLKIVAAPGGDLKFVPSNGNVEDRSRDVRSRRSRRAATRFAFDDPDDAVQDAQPRRDRARRCRGVAFFGKAGTYTFFCTVTGTRPPA